MRRLSLDATRRALEPALRRVLHAYWRFARAMTLGVRALVIDEEGRVFLVKHSYVSGWHLPGGGVEAGETLSEALARELQEEGNIEMTAPPQLHGLFFNDRDSRRDAAAVVNVGLCLVTEAEAHGQRPSDFPVVTNESSEIELTY